jgi:hypothetical protein
MQISSISVIKTTERKAAIKKILAMMELKND